jgi:hypothetical protein
MMIDTEHVLTALVFAVGLITLTLLWIRLALTLVQAIAQLWRDLFGIRVCRRPTVVQRHPLGVGHPVRVASGETTSSGPQHRPSLLSKLFSWLQPLIGKPKRTPRRTNSAWTRRNDPRPTPTRSPMRESKPPLTAATIPPNSERDARQTVPLFVVDVPQFQSNPDVFDARPGDILEVLDDACSTAKAADRSDAEIARMLSGEASR